MFFLAYYTPHSHVRVNPAPYARYCIQSDTATSAGLFLMPFFASEKADHPFASTLLFLTSDLSRQHFFFYTRSCGSPCLNLRLILFLCVSHNRLVHDPALLRSICSARSEHIKQVYEPSCTTKPTHLLVSLPHLSASHLLALVFLCIIIS